MYVCLFPVLRDWTQAFWGQWTPKAEFVLGRVTDYLCQLTEDVFRDEFGEAALDSEGCFDLSVGSTNVICRFVLNGDRLDLIDIDPPLPHAKAAAFGD